MNEGWLSDGMNIEADLKELSMVQNISVIKEESRLGHGMKDDFIIQFGKESPLGQQGNGVGIHGRRIEFRFKDHPSGILAQIDACIVQGMGGRSEPLRPSPPKEPDRPDKIGGNIHGGLYHKREGMPKN